MMSRWKWTLTRVADALGLPGLITLALVIGLLLFFLLVRWPMQQRIEAAETGSMQPDVSNVPVEAPASAFLKQLPRPEKLSPELQTIFDTAEGYGLVLNEVAYRKVRKQDERLERYHVDFAIDAPYPDIRAFLADVLAAIPSAALAQLALTRDDVRSSDVRARVRLTLFLVRS